MDLGTVKKKIKNKEYTSFLQCGEDVKLIWNNCMTYNADGSDFYKLAQSLYKRWDTQYSKFLNDIGAKDIALSGGNQPASVTSSSNVPSGSTSNSVNGTQPQHAVDRKVTLQEKRNLAKSFYQLSKEDLGKVLIEIEKRTPAAIKRNASEDELDLIMDAIDVPTMTYLTNMVNGYVHNDYRCPILLPIKLKRTLHLSYICRYSLISMKSNPGKKKPPPGSKASASSGSKKAKVAEQKVGSS
jgi:Bromodomain/Bromodomain extra-terminal - transcription regulation